MTVKPCVVIDLAQLTMNFDRRYALCIQKFYHKPHFTVGWFWNKSHDLQPLQRCYCENSGGPSCDVITLTYMQSLYTINGLIALRRVRNLLCGRPSYVTYFVSLKNCNNYSLIVNIRSTIIIDHIFTLRQFFRKMCRVGL